MSSSFSSSPSSLDGVGGSSSLDGGLFGPAPAVGVLPDGRRCQSAHSLLEAHVSMGVVVLSALVWGLVLLGYVAGEGRVRRHLESVSLSDGPPEAPPARERGDGGGDEAAAPEEEEEAGHAIASFLEMGFEREVAGSSLLQGGAASGAAAAFALGGSKSIVSRNSTNHSGAHLYLPPLPRSVLQSLKTVSEATPAAALVEPDAGAARAVKHQHPAAAYIQSPRDLM